MPDFNNIIKNDTSFTKLTNDEINNKNIAFVNEDYYISNVQKQDIPDAGPMIFAHQIDWSGLTTTVNDLPIEINTSQDVVGYLAGALDLVYNGLHQELGDYSTKLNITYNMLESYASYFNNFSKIIQTYDMIQTYVVEGDNYSTIKQTYDMIQTYVVNNNNFSRFTQTADMFETYVSSYTGDFSYIRQTADYIQTYVASYTGDFSKITQTADKIESIVQTYNGSWSQFKQTADAISAVVQGYNESYAKWNISSEGIDATVLDGYTNSYARWNMTADGFKQTVDSYLGSWSQFKQTADAISAVVQGYNESYAKWNISSEGIDATVLDGYTNSYARWNMTADGFDQTVDAYLGSWSQFKQTADAISAVVQGYNEGYAKWNIAYNNINMSVEDAVNNYMSTLDICADKIKGEVVSDIAESYLLLTSESFDVNVGQKVSDKFTSLHLDPNAINATVQGYNENYAKWNIAYDQISSKVWNNDFDSLIEQKADSITSTVTQHLENSDYFDSFVNHQDLAAYATKNDLNSYATVSSLNEYATNSRVDQLSDEISLSVTKQQFTDALASYTTKSYISTWVIDPLNDLNDQIINVNDKLDTISLAEHVTYSANIIDSYASIDINGYLNASVDLFVWKDGNADDGEGNVILTHEAISNAIVWAYLPDGLVESGNPYRVNVINNTNEYKDVRQFTEIDKTKAKGNLRLDIQIQD